MDNKVQSMFEDFKIMNEPTITVTVQFVPDKMVEELAKIYLSEMYRVSQSHGERLLKGIDADDIRRYLCTLSFMRRTHVVDLRNAVTKAYASGKTSYAVPTFWYQILLMIGEAVDKDYSIKFIPGTSIDETDLLSPEEMLSISDIMFELQNVGFAVVAGTPRDVVGDLAFMAMAHVEERSFSYKRSHPVYGFLASFFAMKEVEQALGTLVRVTYGYDSDYRTLLRRVITAQGGDTSCIGKMNSQEESQ